MITTELIKELRDKTGVSIMQCKKALESVGGDIEKAIVVLKKKGSETASKKSDRKIGAGVISTYVHMDTIGTMVELVCETDFVARNKEFKDLAYNIAMQVAAMNPTFIKMEEITEKDKKTASEVFENEIKDKPKELQEKILGGKLLSYFKDKVLLEQSFIKDPDNTIKNLIESATQKFGEKIEITRFVRFSLLDK